jgi:hypothetical protein
MTTAEVLRRLRLFLLVLSSLLFIGTLVELWLVNHTEDAIQWLAFVLAGLGLIATLSVLVRRGRKTVLVLRACMLVVVLGSLFGIYEHVSNNIAFEREIHPNATFSQVVWKGLSGANPLLAPGTLAVAGLLALASTYKYSVTGDLDST